MAKDLKEKFIGLLETIKTRIPEERDFLEQEIKKIKTSSNIHHDQQSAEDVSYYIFLVSSAIKKIREDRRIKEKTNDLDQALTLLSSLDKKSTPGKS